MGNSVHMASLSIKEITFLRNPEKFNANYRYVLIHRIKKKEEKIKDILGIIKKHERSLMNEKERKEYDEQKAIEQQRKEFNLQKPRWTFTPNFDEVVRRINTGFLELGRDINMLDSFFKDETVQKHYKSLSDLQKKQLKKYFAILIERSDSYSNTLKLLIKAVEE